MKLALLKNRNIYPCALPFPLAGVLVPGEDITTRYNAARLGFLLGMGAQAPGMDVLRWLEVAAGPDSADVGEAGVSGKSPPRDYFAGSVVTEGAVSAPIAWRAENSPALIPATSFAPNSVVMGVLTVAGNAADGTNYATYQRSVRLVVGPDQTIVASNFQTIGTDVETQAGANITLAAPASGLTVTMLGVTGEIYRWSASYDIQAYTLGG